MQKRLLLCCAVVMLFLAAPVFANEALVSDFDTAASTYVTSGGGGTQWADCQLVPDYVMGPSGQSFLVLWGNTDSANEWAGGGVRFQPSLTGTTDISAYNNISFFVFTPRAGMKATIKLNDYVGGTEHGGRVKLSDYVTTVSSSWQEVVIPVAAFKRDNPTLDLTKANNFVLVADVTNGLEYDSSGTVRVENLKLSTQPRAPYNSLIYSGGDKGTGNVDDLAGDTLVWWDQAGSSVTSNEVTVRVSAGYGEAWVTTPAATNNATGGTTNYYAFQIRNDGNRADRIVFSTQTLNGTNPWQARTFYDKDKSGTFTAGDDICWDTIGLLPQSTHYFLVGVYVPVGAANASSTTVRLTAKDNFGSGANDSWPTGANDDTVTYDFSAVCAGPSIAVVKSTSTATGKPGDTVTYTITATNSGSAAATNLVLVDVIPMNMELGGAAAGAGATITYYVGSAWQGSWAANATKVRWTWASVASAGGTASGNYPAKIK